MLADVAVTASLNSLTPGQLDSSFASLQNPYALEALAGLISGLINLLLVGPLSFSFIVAAAGLFGRLRRSSGQGRQQFNRRSYDAERM